MRWNMYILRKFEMAISTGAAILGAGALSAGVGLFQGYQAGQAADVQAAAAQQAGQIQERQYQQTREDLAPWRTVGEQALYQYADLLGIPAPGAEGPVTPDYSAFTESPGYQFRLAEGQKAIERSQAARGLLGSGQTLKAITEYGQNIASQEYGNYMNRLSGLAGVGQATTVQTGQFGASAAAQTGGAIEAAGRARASGYLGTGQALGGVASDVAGLTGYYVGQQSQEEMLRRLGY